MLLGSVPDSRVPTSHKARNWWSSPISEGMVPERRVAAKETCWSADARPSSVGSVPLKCLQLCVNMLRALPSQPSSERARQKNVVEL